MPDLIRLARRGIDQTKTAAERRARKICLLRQTV